MRGISGIAIAEGIGTIKFTITDNSGKKHEITLDNVIHLPEASKNLISITQWSKEKNDDCGIFSRGERSLFMRNNDSKRKLIHHDPTSCIQLLPINESDNDFTYFLRTHSDDLIDNVCLLQDGVHIQNDSEEAIKSNKQFVDVDSQLRNQETIPVGTVVRAQIENDDKICIVMREYRKPDCDQEYEVRQLNSSKRNKVSKVKIVNLDPADIPKSHQNLDAEIMTRCMTREDLENLCNCSTDGTVSEENRRTFYWHHILQYIPLIHLKRLSERRIIPKYIATIVKMPLCAACTFSTTHRRNWRFKKSKSKGNNENNRIRGKSQQPGDGTACYHIVSAQPGLVPQSMGKLTNDRFWGSVIYVDDISDFIYNHLVKRISSKETLESKLSYERVLLSYGRKAQGYHADNLRFNDSNFKGSCIKGGQKLTFCGVGAHHQNGIVETKNKIVCNGARTLLLHAKRKWPKIISTVLYPYASQEKVN